MTSSSIYNLQKKLLLSYYHLQLLHKLKILSFKEHAILFVSQQLLV